MDSGWTGAILAALLGGALAACAPASAQQEGGLQQDRGLRPPPAYEREYQSYCRDRPAACAGGYGQARDGFLINRQDDAMDTVRQRERESQQMLQQQLRR